MTIIDIRRGVPRLAFPQKPPLPTLFFDQETLPTDDPVVIERLASKIVPPSNYKKADTIAEWELLEKPKLIQEAIHKTGLDGAYGRICCIGWAFDDRPVQSLIGDEKDIITEFIQQVYAYRAGTTFQIVGHNVWGFDLRFLYQRCAVHAIRRPPSIPFQASKFDTRIQDTMLMWDSEKRISQDNLCRVLGIDSYKDTFDGSMVADAWAAGRYSRITTHCEDDVEAVRQIWWRLR